MTRNSSKLQGQLMERDDMANYISEAICSQNEFLMKNNAFLHQLKSKKKRNKADVSQRRQASVLSVASLTT